MSIRRLVLLSMVGAALWALMIGLGARVWAQEAGWELSYDNGAFGNPDTGPSLSWTCPLSGTGAGTVLEADPGNDSTSGTYLNLQVDSGCDPEVGQTLRFGEWAADIVAVTDPSPPESTTTTTTTSTTTTTTIAAWSNEQIESLVQSSSSTAGAVRVIGVGLIMMGLVAMWRSYRARN